MSVKHQHRKAEMAPKPNWFFMAAFDKTKWLQKAIKNGTPNMKKIVKILLAQRSDGKFLRLNEEDPNATTYDFVDEPEFAKQKIPVDSDDLKKPHDASYYFENSFRAREYWLKDCKMVAYEIITNAKFKKL